MTTPDIINASFEGVAGLFIWLNVLRLYKDKKIQGVHWLPTTVFVMWGFWNLYYYPHLSQYLSFIGGLLVVSANTVWLGQIIFYSLKGKTDD